MKGWVEERLQKENVVASKWREAGRGRRRGDTGWDLDLSTLSANDRRLWTLTRSAVVCDMSANIQVWHLSESRNQDHGWNCQATQTTCQTLTSTSPHIDSCHRADTATPQSPWCGRILQEPKCPQKLECWFSLSRSTHTHTRFSYWSILKLMLQNTLKTNKTTLNYCRLQHI